MEIKVNNLKFKDDKYTYIIEDEELTKMNIQIKNILGEPNNDRSK